MNTKILRPYVVQLKNEEGNWEIWDEYFLGGRDLAILKARDLHEQFKRESRVVRLNFVKEYK